MIISTKKIIDLMARLLDRSSQVHEPWHRLSAAGKLNHITSELLILLLDELHAIGFTPTLRINDHLWAHDDGYDCFSEQTDGDWELLLDKQRFLESLGFAFSQSKFLIFLTEKAFKEWSSDLNIIDLHGLINKQHTTIIVKFAHSEVDFGGFGFRVCSIDRFIAQPEPIDSPTELPDDEAVHKQIHLISERALAISPRALVPTYGMIDHQWAMPFRRLGAIAMALSLASDVYAQDHRLRAVLRGTRRLELDAVSNDSNSATLNHAQLKQLRDAVAWVYSERPETRHKLISDRLSIDIETDSSLVNGITKHIESALKQAREQYDFVILDRKDAYHKELRDVLKDVRTQADLFATKIRELVSGLLRDILGLLVLVGFSLIGKANPLDIVNQSHSTEVQVFFKVLAIYFTISSVFQIATSARDMHLTSDEARGWLNHTRNYVAPGVITEEFDKRLKRRQWFYAFCVVCVAAIYIGLIIACWNSATSVAWLLAYL